jgi:DNA repair exonuclease SbcCD ATPase subunit
MIILKKLKWSNCFSYGENVELDLTSATLTQLVGTNGVGKSSIPLILEEVLFNKNSKGVKKADIPNRHVNKGYTINLTFSVDEDDYEIDVNRKTNIKCKLLKNGKDISSHTATNTYKTVEDLLKLDFKTFTQLVYQNTNASLQFLTATDTNRKKFLIDLLNLDQYVEFFEVFKEETRLSSQQLAHLNGKSEQIVSWLENNNSMDMTLLPKVDLPKISEEDEETLRSLLIEIENISENNRKILANENYKKALRNINITEYQNLISNGKIEDTEFMRESLGEWKSELAREKNMRSKYEQLRNSEEAECPTCEQPIDFEFIERQYEEHNKSAEYISGEITKISEKIEKAEQNNKLLQHAEQQIDEWEKLYKSIDQSLPTKTAIKDELEDKVVILKTKIQAERGALEEAIEENTKIERHNTKVSIWQEQSEDYETQLEEVTSGIIDEEARNTYLEVLKKAFSTNGLLAYKIESLVKDLEELANKYLAELSDGRFNLQFVINNDKLNVEVDDNGKAVEILALSSGELARVNIATLIAIRKLMASISKSRINILFLDEVTQALDEQGKEKVVEVLLGEDNLNTFMVSHGWTHPLLAKIEVIKENNMSHLNDG